MTGPEAAPSRPWRRNWRPRHGLRWQLVWAVGLVHALLMGVFVVDLTWRDVERLQAQEVQHAESLATSLAVAAAPGVLSRDLAGLQQLLQPLAARPGVAYALVCDDQGQVLAHTDLQRVGQRLTPLPAAGEQPVVVHDSLAGADIMAPVRAADRVRGWARVALSAQPAAAVLKEAVAAGLAYALLAIVTGSLMAAWLARLTTQRLAALQQVAQAVTAGDMVQRSRLAGDDEAAALSRAMDAMLDALDQASAHQRLAAEAGGLAVWRWEVGADHTLWLAGRERLLGPAPADGWPDFRAMVHEDDRPAFLEANQRAVSGEAGHYEATFRLRRTDGALVHLHAIGTVERDAEGRPLGLIGVTRDETAEREHALRLAESESFARQLFDANPEPLLLVDAQGVIRAANQRALRLTGHAQLVGLPVEDLVPAAARKRHVGQRESTTARLADGQPLRTAGMRLLTADGREVTVRVTLAAVQHSGQMLTLAAVQDVTEETALRQALEHQSAQLEDEVRRRTAQFEQARARAEQLSLAKGQFLAQMSHEVRTPLNAILGMAHLGRSSGATGADRERFAHIEHAGEHLLSIVNDVLDAHQIEAGRIQVLQVPFDVLGWLHETAAWYQTLAVDKGLTLDCRVAPDVPAWALGDERRLRQVLANLLSNAIKFTDDGEVRLRATFEDGTLFVKVADTGPGMDAQTLSRLFQPFEQGDASLARRHSGSGLGLSISRQLAQLMGGVVSAESSPGEGSVFTLVLPLRTCAAPTRQAEAAALPGGDSRPLAGRRILVVDDVEVNRLIAEAMLQQLGAEVWLADSGMMALERVQAAPRGSLHAVLMDVQMPGMDGLETTRRLRTLAPEVPVIGLTAHVLDHQRLHFAEAGMVAQLGKPLLPDELARVVAAHALTPAVRG